MSREAMKLALEALNTTESDCGSRAWEREQEAITALREALASGAIEQPAQFVAWMEMVVANLVREGINKHKARELAQHFYTSPQPAQRKPLTDEEIMAIGKELGLKCRFGGNPNIDFDYARAIEAAHGIKENT